MVGFSYATSKRKQADLLTLLAKDLVLFMLEYRRIGTLTWDLSILVKESEI